MGGPQFCQYCCSFGVWQTASRELYRTIARHYSFFKCPRELTLGRETKTDISCEWNTKFWIIPEIPSKRVHLKRIPKFSKTFPGIFTVPFNFGPEISEFLVEWKAPLVDLSDVSRRCYFCRKEDCSPFDIGSIVYRVTAPFTDAEKFRFIESVWKPDLLLKIPASKETSEKQ